MDELKAIEIVQGYIIDHFNELNDEDRQAMHILTQRRVSEWVSVEERLPTAEDADKNGDILVETLSDQHPTLSVTFANILIEQDKLKRWMPLPKPPKEGE